MDYALVTQLKKNYFKSSGVGISSQNTRPEVGGTVQGSRVMAEGKIFSTKVVTHCPRITDGRALPIVFLLQPCGLPMSGSSFPSYSLKYSTFQLHALSLACLSHLPSLPHHRYRWESILLLG